MTRPTLDGVLRRSDDAAGVRFERHYDTGAADLWAAVTEPDRLARWLAPVTGERAVGGRVHLHFDDGPAELEVTECRPGRRLVVHWLGPARPSRCTLTLTPLADDRTRLLLDHDALPLSSAPGRAAGWHWYLDALGAVLTGGSVAPWDDAFPALFAAYGEVSPS